MARRPIAWHRNWKHTAEKAVMVVMMMVMVMVVMMMMVKLG